MYLVDVYLRIRRAVMVEGMSVWEAPGCSACTGTRRARCWPTLSRQDNGERSRRRGREIVYDQVLGHPVEEGPGRLQPAMTSSSFCWRMGQRKQWREWHSPALRQLRLTRKRRSDG